MTESDQLNKKTPGELLKEIRESRGITLDDVHGETKIPLDVLRAIEEGYTVRTLSPFYLKGFIKMYAQYLGVNTENFVYETEEFKKEEKPPVKDPIGIKVEPKEDFGKVWQQEVIGVFDRRRQKQAVQVLGVLLVIFFIVKIGGCLQRYAALKSEKEGVTKQASKKIQAKAVSKKKAKEVKTPAKSKSKPKPKPVPKPQAAVPASKKTPKATAPKKESKEFKLTITSQRNGWLQVKVDGNLVFQSTMKKGMKETWSAKDSIEISGKSIHYLSYAIDGKELPGLKDAGQTARRVVVTKKGLFVKK